MSGDTAQALAWVALFQLVAFMGSLIGPLIIVAIIMTIARAIFR
jgi:hypothetical protein